MKIVVIDADAGTDDALALMMAFNSPELDVLGVTTVGGNATLAHTTRNALRLLEYLRRRVPVYRGSARPLRGAFRYAYDFHGPAGLGVRLPEPSWVADPVSAPEALVALGSANRGELVIVALGPLTNVAKALVEEPRLAEWTKELVVMGGAVGVPGNVTPFAEFNVYNDPEAANVVLSSGIPTTLVGLDVCTRTVVTSEEDPWFPGRSGTARLANRVLGNWFSAHPGRRYDLCDPLAMVAAVDPDVLGYRDADVTVVTDGPERGRTVARYGGGPVKVATEVDVEAAKARMRRCLAPDIS